MFVICEEFSLIQRDFFEVDISLDNKLILCLKRSLLYIQRIAKFLW